MPHCFEVELAEKYGLLEAILIEFFKREIQFNKQHNENFYNGKYWAVMSMKVLQKLHPYVTVKRIKTATENLEREGVLLIGAFGKDHRNRTKWYTLTEKGWRS